MKETKTKMKMTSRHAPATKFTLPLIRVWCARGDELDAPWLELLHEAQHQELRQLRHARPPGVGQQPRLRRRLRRGVQQVLGALLKRAEKKKKNSHRARVDAMRPWETWAGRRGEMNPKMSSSPPPTYMSQWVHCSRVPLMHVHCIYIRAGVRAANVSRGTCRGAEGIDGERRTTQE